MKPKWVGSSKCGQVRRPSRCCCLLAKNREAELIGFPPPLFIIFWAFHGVLKLLFFFLILFLLFLLSLLGTPTQQPLLLKKIVKGCPLLGGRGITEFIASKPNPETLVWVCKIGGLGNVFSLYKRIQNGISSKILKR